MTTAPVAPTSSSGMARLRRWAPWVVLVGVAVGALIIGSSRNSHPTPAQQAASIASSVRCPVCSGESAEQSQTPESAEIRQQISQELAAGLTRSQILDRLVASFGPGILEKPQTSGVSLLVWVLPIVGAAVAALGLAFAFVRWRPRRTTGPDASDQARVAQELADEGGGAGIP